MIKTIISKTQNKNDLLVHKEILEILSTIKRMDVSELEKLLDEEIKSKSLGKYYFLAFMQDIFQIFKSSNDEVLEVESGTCIKNCHSNCLVYNLRGKTSKKNFSFVIEKESGKIKGLHSCLGFIDSDNKFVPPNSELYLTTMLKTYEITGEEPGGYPLKALVPNFVEGLIEISVKEEIKEKFGTDVKSATRIEE